VISKDYKGIIMLALEEKGQRRAVEWLVDVQFIPFIKEADD
jgi:hypothetical protein